MACKCDIQLENQKFNLNIDLTKLQGLDLHNADGFFPGTIGDYPEQLENLGNNIYVTRTSNYTSREISRLQEAIASVKNSFSCNCLKSKIDLIKFVLTNPRDSNALRGGPGLGFGTAAAVPNCNNTVLINTMAKEPYPHDPSTSMLSYQVQQIQKIITHEVIHLMDGCFPCRSKTKNALFNTQRDLLYRQYKLIHRDIRRFHKQFTKDLIDSNVIELKPPATTIIDERFAFIELDYALTNKAEFLAVFSQFFCLEMDYNTLALINSNSYTIKNPNVTQETLRALYIYRFNLTYKNIIARICELVNKIQSDPDNCDESVTSGIECSLSLSCGTRILIGLNLCCNAYNIYLDIDSDAGCCSAEKSDQKKNPIYVGSINLVNQCKCYYSYSPYMDIQKIIKTLNNCCSGMDLYPINAKSEAAKNFTEDLSNQIYNNLKNIIETSSEAKLFLNSVPCD